ncbi:MAG: alpha-galactosidase [Acidobacteria bacterium]|nr:alpha-galactosidase [Acidobacteriota bacterium]
MKSRREFLSSATAAGLLLSVDGSLISGPNSSAAAIENQFLSARFDTASGLIHAERKDGTALLRNAVARATLSSATLSTSDSDYARKYSIRPCRNALGNGRQLSATCTDHRRQLDFEIQLTLYDGRNALQIEVICRNASKSDLNLLKIEPVRAVLEEEADCGWPDAEKALTNGYLYADPGRVEDLGQANRHAVTSMWNMGFHRGEHSEGLVIGYLENDVATGRISALYDHTVTPAQSQGGMSLTIESLYNLGFVLRPGASISSGKVIFNIAADTFTALETFAQSIADLHQFRLNPIINGWCNWYYTHEYISEDEVLKNADFAARYLKQYGLEFIQIDAGWFRTYGDWEGNERFPHGMKWLASQIRERGLRAGIWLAPYCIAEGTDLFTHHQDWLITNTEGKVKQCGGGLTTPQVGPYGIPSLMKKVYGLDITHPDAADWLREQCRRISADWGYDFLKIDFVEWSLLSAERYHNPSVSQAAAYRLGMQTIREGIGPKCHLLDCGPMNCTVGLIDSARIELDQPHLTWEQYTANSNSNAPAMAKRYYFNRKTWTNDADHLGLALLTVPQAKAAASIIALSGGTMISGDRLVDLDPERLEILRKVFPSYGVAARPIDLFETDKPEIFELPIKTSFGEWSVVALFNYSNGTSDKRVPFSRLRLPKSNSYVAFEFWSQRLAGEFKTDLTYSVMPQSVALFAVHPRKEVPFVLSTDRHFTQGAVELAEAKWDASKNTLIGTSKGPTGSAHRMTVYIPAAYRWNTTHPGYVEDLGNYSVRQTAPDLLCVRPRFDTSQTVSWQINFQRA